MARIKVRPDGGASFDFVSWGTFLGDAIIDGDARAFSGSVITLIYRGTHRISGSGIDLEGKGAGSIRTWDSDGAAIGDFKIAKMNFSMRRLNSIIEAEDGPGRSLAMENFLLKQSWNYKGTDARDVLRKNSRIGDGAKADLSGDDRFDLGGGNDRFWSGGGDDVLKGGVGGDKLDGGSGKDRVFGNAGKDRIDGGRGDDKLKGGADDDVFRLAAKGGRDVVLDYSEGDRIDLKKVRGVDGFDDVEAAMRKQGKHVLLAFGEDSLLLKNVKTSELDDDDFIL